MPGDSPPAWLDAATIAAVYGVSPRAVQLAFGHAAETGRPWRGATLILRQVPSAGHGGLAWQCRADSLPPLKLEYDSNLPDRQIGTGSDAPAPPARPEAPRMRRSASASERYEIIAPVLRQRPGKSERRKAAEAAAASAGVTVRTIERWAAAYEADGAHGIKVDFNPGRGRRKADVTRAFDAFAAAHLDEDAAARVGAKIKHFIKRLWVSDAELTPRIAMRLASHELCKLVIEVGYAGDEGALKDACKLSRRFVERHRKRYQSAAIEAQDAKQYADNQPRVWRTFAGRAPMEIVYGDVHPMDVLLERADGSTFTPKLICFEDAATKRIFVYPVFLAKGGGVRQGHVIDALVAMTQAPGWGLPETLYIDNGAEYSIMDLAADAFRLTMQVRAFGEAPDLGDDAPSVRRALPYNSSAKPIEGTFRLLERDYFSKMPGWIGGDRMEKKTQNVGREPVPYLDGDAAFRRDLANCVTLYETQPQHGDLGGLSPREKFNRAEAGGWKRMDVDPYALRAAFARTDTRIVKKGCVSHLGQKFTAPELQALAANTQVNVRIPVQVAPLEAIPIMDSRGQLLCVATLDRPYDALDRAGAEESGRRKKRARDAIRAVRAAAPPLDLRAKMAEIAADAEPEAVPESAGRIELSEAMAATGRALAKTPKERLAEAAEQERISRERQRKAADRFLEKYRKTGTDG